MPTTRVGEYLRIVLGILMVNIIDPINATLQKITLFENLLAKILFQVVENVTKSPLLW